MLLLTDCIPLKGKAPGNNPNIFWQTHRKKHFRPKHTRISNFYPFLKAFMVADKTKGYDDINAELNNCVFTLKILLQPENFHAGLSIRVISRFEPKLGHSCD